jgi:pimeloyl-ACP methyl ester carboxylesterase/2-polyprenyl-6-methoxyphenol hydroxylase-like FAD-dependent oxidoreductase
MLPADLTDGLRHGDAEIETVTARRPALEGALAAVAGRTRGVCVRRGVKVTGLAAADGRGIAQVNGVLTASGETIPADLVVDASGRRTSVPAMLAAIGARRPYEEREEAGFVYYARHFRAVSSDRGVHGMPTPRALLAQLYHGYGLLTLPGDRDTWGVAVVASSRDHAVRGLRDVDAWSRAVELVPDARPWLDGEPITDVSVIAGTEDRYRRYVVDGVPVCTGLVAVGDAWACTNPSLGRGSSIGLLHAVTLRDVLRETAGNGVGVGDPERLVRAFDEATESRVTPWYRATRAFDRHRLAEIDADIDQRPYRTADPSWAMTTALYTAAVRDPDALRAQLSIAHLLASPPEALARPRLVERVIALGASRPRYDPAAPRHDELVAAIDHRSAAPRPITDSPVRLFVEERGHGEPVLLLHGWPDCHTVWRRQVDALTAAGYRTIAPDLRGFGDSDKPDPVPAYGMLPVLADLLGVLDRLDVEQVHVVGHDWGGAIGSMLAALAPARVASLTCLSVGHPAAFRSAGWEQREKSWYMLLFQFPGIAEQWLSANDFANLRAWARHPQIDEVVARFRDPRALRASLGLYRAILPPETLIAPAAQDPRISAPTMGLWSTGDFALTEAAVTGTERHVTGPWRYERIEGAGHWIQLDAPEVVNELLLDFFAESRAERRVPAA